MEAQGVLCEMIVIYIVLERTLDSGVRRAKHGDVA